MSRRFSSIEIEDISNEEIGQKISEKIVGWTNNTRKYPMLDDFIIPELSENES